MMHLYRVRMTGCGHVETRRMREATAGIPWTESAELASSPGAKCLLCRAQEICDQLFSWRRDAGQYGPWTDQVAKMIKGTDAESVVNSVYRAIPRIDATWAEAFEAVQNGHAREILHPSPKCTTCTRPALYPFRRVNRDLQITEGCIDACHGPHVRHADKAWHERPEAVAHRAAVAASREALLSAAHAVQWSPERDAAQSALSRKGVQS